MDVSKLERLGQDYKNKEGLLKKEINRLKEECFDLKERISIIEEREKESLTIIKAQKRQIEDLRVLETDLDARSLEYRKLLTQLSNTGLEIEALKEQMNGKNKEIKEYEEIINLEREEYINKYEELEKEISRVTEIKEKLYQNGTELFNKNTELENKIQVIQIEETKTKCLIMKLEQKLNETVSTLEETKERSSQQELELITLRKELKTAIHLKN